MGDSEQDKAIKFALLEQRVDLLEKWRVGYEESQNQRFQRIEEKLDKLFTLMTQEKDRWLSNPPWWLVAVISGMIGVITYFMTK